MANCYTALNKDATQTDRNAVYYPCMNSLNSFRKKGPDQNWLTGKGWFSHACHQATTT